MTFEVEIFFCGCQALYLPACVCWEVIFVTEQLWHFHLLTRLPQASGETLNYLSRVTEDVLNPFRLSFESVRVCVCAEVDDLAVYLDQLLAVPQQISISDTKGGLNRFRAAARKTREMVSLVHKARDLNIHSEFKMHSNSVFCFCEHSQMIFFWTFPQMCTCTFPLNSSGLQHQTLTCWITKAR